MTGDTCPGLLLAHFAHIFIPRRRNRGYTFRRLEGFCIPKFDFRSEDCTCHVHPIVVSGSFERFSRVHRFIELFLFLAEKVGVLLRFFSLHTLLFALLLTLFLMRSFDWLNKIVLGMLNWT
jgi:hypothetical protein